MPIENLKRQVAHQDLRIAGLEKGILILRDDLEGQKKMIRELVTKVDILISTLMHPQGGA